jgi:hypothetical protein
MIKFNRTIGVVAAGLCLAGVTSPAFAQAQQRLVGTSRVEAVAAPRAPQAEQAPARLICVRDQLTGSHINRRVCRTQAEWDRMGGLAED